MKKTPRQNGKNRKFGITEVLGFFFSSVLFFASAVAMFLGVEDGIETHNTLQLVSSLLVALLFSSIGSLFLFIMWECAPLRYRPPRKKIPVSIAFATLLVSISFIALDRSTQPRPEFDDQYWSAMNDACKGLGIAEAAIYSPGLGIHRVALTTERDPLGLYANMPYEWLPDSLTKTELVVCMDDEERILIETCDYTPYGYFERYQRRRTVYLVAAYTGEVIVRKTFYGGLPKPCPRRKHASDKGDVGSDVSVNDVLDWMRPYVEQQ